MLLLSTEARKRGSAEAEDFRADEVEIPFPDGSRVKFRVQGSGFSAQDKSAWASVVKDAGDDPDVTNGAEIVAEVRKVQKRGSAEARKQRTSSLPRFIASSLVIKGGRGVGTVTKPGLPVPVGEPAINPVPRKMIKEAVMEAINESAEARKRGSGEAKNFLTSSLPHFLALDVTISVPNGGELAKKTLNSRLGITGGISILGTTGIVKPVSTEAWTATISSSMGVAKAMGHQVIVLSAGRTSEKAHMKKFSLPEESYVLMGDYLEYSLREASKQGFERIHLCAQWAKMVKIAMATPQTHVRFGAIDIEKAVQFLCAEEHGSILFKAVQNSSKNFNTAREIFDFINSELKTQNSKLYLDVCTSARKYAEGIASGIPVFTYLVSYEGEIIAGSE